jgi:hypothetical protein
MAGVEAPALRDSIANAPAPQFFWGRTTSVRFTDLVGRAGLNCGTSLGGRRTELAGRSVLVATGSQLTAALALIERDGIARRLVVLPPDVGADDLDAVLPKWFSRRRAKRGKSS